MSSSAAVANSISDRLLRWTSVAVASCRRLRSAPKSQLFSPKLARRGAVPWQSGATRAEKGFWKCVRTSATRLLRPSVRNRLEVMDAAEGCAQDWDLARLLQSKPEFCDAPHEAGGPLKSKGTLQFMEGGRETPAKLSPVPHFILRSSLGWICWQTEALIVTTLFMLLQLRRSPRKLRDKINLN